MAENLLMMQTLLQKHLEAKRKILKSISDGMRQLGMEPVMIIYSQPGTVFMEEWDPANHKYALIEKILLLILPCILFPQTLLLPYKLKGHESK